MFIYSFAWLEAGARRGPYDKAIHQLLIAIRNSISFASLKQPFFVIHAPTHIRTRSLTHVDVCQKNMLTRTHTHSERFFGYNFDDNVLSLCSNAIYLLCVGRVIFPLGIKCRLIGWFRQRLSDNRTPENNNNTKGGKGARLSVWIKDDKSQTKHNRNSHLSVRHFEFNSGRWSHVSILTTSSRVLSLDNLSNVLDSKRVPRA